MSQHFEKTNYTYRESDNLKLRGGYMLIHQEDCHITINAQLSIEEKEVGRIHMLKHRAELESQEGGMYIWSIDKSNNLENTGQ
jgi:hypothetical protein